MITNKTLRQKDSLDLKDRKILYQLDINSRQSNSSIAKKVGLSKDVVNYRIKKLEEQGFIKGYYTILDFSRLGYISIRVYIKLLDANPEKENEIVNFLVSNKKVFFCSRIEGPFDISFGTWVGDIYEFEDFYFDFKRQFKQNLGESKISIFTKAYHFHRAYLIDKKMDEVNPEYFGREKFVEHDENDIKILKLIAKNARIPMIEISEKLKIPPATIAFRIKNLEKKKIIQGYRFIFNFVKYGYEYYKVDIILKNILRLRHFLDFSHINPNIVYVDQTIGESDFEFDVEVKNKEEFLRLINIMREQFPEIRSWTFFSVRSYDKLLYFPEN